MISKKWLFSIFLIFSLVSFSQTYDSYRPERDRVHDLVHTKLKVDFNFDKKELNGEAWVTAKPHFYATGHFSLDAKAMIIHQVSFNNEILEYSYDDYKINIDLPKEFRKGEEFTIYIKYTARPEKVAQKGSAAITSAKGLYFINADGYDKNKPTQIWTQGETEASSCWFPTIDTPIRKLPKKFILLFLRDL